MLFYIVIFDILIMEKKNSLSIKGDKLSKVLEIKTEDQKLSWF